jgi:hypothetical protein
MPNLPEDQYRELQERLGGELVDQVTGELTDFILKRAYREQEKDRFFCQMLDMVHLAVDAGRKLGREIVIKGLEREIHRRGLELGKEE